MDPDKISKGREFYNPYWIGGIIFFIANGFLSHGSMSTGLSWVTVVLGILLPFFGILYFSKTDSPKNQSLKKREIFTDIPFWIWLLVLGGSLAIRLYKLTTLSQWPLYDEGMYGYYALHWGDPGQSLFFFGPSQAPPLYIWGLHLFFKTLGASLSTLWLFPALISFFILPVGYWAARQFFSVSFSFLLALFLGLGFWPVYVGRFGVMTGLVLLFECLVLGLAGNLWRETNSARVPWKAVALGIGWGLGFYTYLHWPLFALCIFFTTGIVLSQKHFKNNRKFFIRITACFLVSAFFTLLPLVSAFFWEGGSQYWDYIRHLASPSGLTMIERLSLSLSYIGSLFWGMDLKFHTYQPIWGGYLNPLMDMLFFLGLSQAVKGWRNPLYAWLLAALFLFILPGLLTTERATSRLILAAPILAVFCALGFMVLFPRFKKWDLTVALVLFVLSSALDFYHLAGAYSGVWKDLNNWKGYTKSYTRFQAFGDLRKISHDQGPGFILDDLEPGLADQTLVVACHNFNAFDHPEIPATQIHWVGVLTNVNDQPFLKSRFPDGKAFWLSKNLEESDGGWMLWIFSLTPNRWPEISRWVEADRALTPVEEQTLCYVPGRSFDKICQSLETIHSFFKGDRFLETCYWEKMADLSFKAAMAEAPNNGPQMEYSRFCLQQALQQGYPAAHLYQHLALLEWIAGHKTQAESDFKKALKAPLDMTTAGDNLDQLESSMPLQSNNP